MKKILYVFFILVLLFSLSFAKKERNKKSKDSIIQLKDSYTFEDIEKLKDSYITNNDKALKKLVAIFEDSNQSYAIRIAALNAVSDSKDPVLKIALENIISNAEFVQTEIMKEALYILVNIEDKSSSESLVKGLALSEKKIMDLRTIIVDAIGENNTEDKIITLLELYEISISNHQRMNELLTLTLGTIDDDRSIPILMEIARDNEIDMKVRNRAIEILSRKDAPELIDFFVEMLGSPNSNDAMMDFVYNSMGLKEKDRMVMALLESYQAGKTRYHAVLYSIMESLKDYQNPQIKPVFIEIAKTDSLFDKPQHPYTEALLSAVPIPDPSHQSNKIILSGEIPNPVSPPKGCFFHPRCRYAQSKCETEAPFLKSLGNQHYSACHFPGQFGSK